MALLIVGSIVGYVVAGAATGAIAQVMYDDHGFGCERADCLWSLVGVIWPLFWIVVLLVVLPYRFVGWAAHRAARNKIPEARVVK